MDGIAVFYLLEAPTPEGGKRGKIKLVMLINTFEEYSRGEEGRGVEENTYIRHSSTFRNF